ncbi:MAG: hypothetical protein ACR2GP_06625 [Burkholderiaceae bacterium]
MKTTFDLPDSLLRKAKAVAADQGRPLRDLVADAIQDKLAALAAAKDELSGKTNEWKAFASHLQRLPDGSYFNPRGIDDESFFESLEMIRDERRGWQPQNPFENESDFPVVDEKGKHSGRAKR